MTTEDILAELREIKFHLSLLTYELRCRAFALFEREILGTQRRIDMFRAFDDNRSPAQIANIAGVSDQAVRNVIRDLQAQEFVSVRIVSGAQVASRNMDRILDWYFSRPESHPQ